MLQPRSQVSTPAGAARGSARRGVAEHWNRLVKKRPILRVEHGVNQTSLLLTRDLSRARLADAPSLCLSEAIADHVMLCCVLACVAVPPGFDCLTDHGRHYIGELASGTLRGAGKAGPTPPPRCPDHELAPRGRTA